VAVTEQGGAIRWSLFCARTLRAAIPLWFRITPNVARKGANVAQKARVEPRASNRVAALPCSLKPVCFMCGSEHERNSDSSSVF
jgi:hypothetical protein